MPDWHSQLQDRPDLLAVNIIELVKVQIKIQHPPKDPKFLSGFLADEGSIIGPSKVLADHHT